MEKKRRKCYVFPARNRIRRYSSGSSERPGRCRRSPLRKNDDSKHTLKNKQQYHNVSMLIVVLLYWALEYQATAYRYGLLNCFDFGCLRSLATGRIRSGPVPRNRTGQRIFAVESNNRTELYQYCMCGSKPHRSMIIPAPEETTGFRTAKILLYKFQVVAKKT